MGNQPAIMDKMTKSEQSPQRDIENQRCPEEKWTEIGPHVER